MADTTFVDEVTVIEAAWLNDLNDFFYTTFQSITTLGSGLRIVSDTLSADSMAGSFLYFDADLDTYIESSNDDDLRFRVGGVDHLQLINSTIQVLGHPVVFDIDGDTYLESPSDDVLDVVASGNVIGKWIASSFNSMPELRLQTTDATGSAGPALTLYRDSASPIAGDFLGQMLFSGEDSASNETAYAAVSAQIVDPTSASEDGRLLLQTMVNTALATRVTIENGMTVGTPTGADQGVGTVNAEGAIYRDGVEREGWEKLSTQVASTSSNITFTITDPTLYRRYMVHLDAVTPSTSGANLWCRVGDGAAVSSANYEYAQAAWESDNTDDSAGTQGATQWVLGGGINSAKPGIFGQFTVVPSASAQPGATWEAGLWNTIPNLVTSKGAGVLQSNVTELDTIYFAFSTGFVGTGTFTLYGLR